jgi:hypothetical protein
MRPFTAIVMIYALNDSTPMTSGSIGSHRAFMGLCITTCACLSLVLFVGWRWYFDSISSRKTLLEMAQKAEARAQDLEKMGLRMDAIEPEEASEPLTLASINQDQPETKSVEPKAEDRHDSPYPQASAIKVMPLQENEEDVVQAIALLDEFWKAENWKDQLPMVIDADRVAALMKDFYEVQQGQIPQPGGLLSKARYSIDGHEILYFSYTSSRPSGTLEVALRRGPQGKFLIDWESLAGYGEMPFQQFRDKRPTKPVMLRAFVRRFEYYNFEFSNSAKFICVKLTSGDSDNSVYAYCERSTELGRWLEEELAGTGPTNYKGYILSVSFPPDAQSNQCVLLNKVMASRWMNLP